MLGKLILEALRCESDSRYAEMHDDWAALSQRTAELAMDDAARDAAFHKDVPPSKAFHQYMQILTMVRDDHGEPIGDYFLEFFAPNARGTADAVYFHSEVLEHVHVNGTAQGLRCLFVDRTDLLHGYYRLIPNPANRQVAVSISAAALGSNIRYFDSTRVGAAGHLVVHEEDSARRAEIGAERLHRNTTHLVEIIIPREPVSRVFKLSQ